MSSGLVPSGGSRRDSFPCLHSSCPCPITLISVAWTSPLLKFKMFLCLLLVRTLAVAFRVFEIIQGNCLIPKSLPQSHLQSFFLYKVNSYVLRITTWISWGAIVKPKTLINYSISVHHKTK